MPSDAQWERHRNMDRGRQEGLLIGCGAMGRTVLQQLAREPVVCIRYVLVSERRRKALQEELGAAIQVICGLDELGALPDFAVECAGHEVLSGIVPELLRLGVDTIVASVGALAEPGMPEALERAAAQGNAQLTLVSGAIPGIDALAAAAHMRLESVSYVGRKPPLGWLGTPAEQAVDLAALDVATVIFEGSARDGARLYPKNANVAAVVALAGIGFDRTQIQLIADPAVTRNTHRLRAQGEFGELDVMVAAQALAGNPKTSALAACSIVLAVRHRLQCIVV
jgi:aspartate dehydrogenase